MRPKSWELRPKKHNSSSVSGANCGLHHAMRSTDDATDNASRHCQSWTCAIPHAVAAALMAVMLPLQRGQRGGLLCCWHKVEKQSRHSSCSHLLNVTWKTQIWDELCKAIACNSWCCCLRDLAVSGMETIKRLHQPCIHSLVLASKELCIECSWGAIHEVHHIEQWTKWLHACNLAHDDWCYQWHQQDLSVTALQSCSKYGF